MSSPDRWLMGGLSIEKPPAKHPLETGYIWSYGKSPKKILGKPSNCGPLPLSIAEENSNRLFDLCDQLRLGFQATLNIRSSLSPPG